MIAIKVLAVVIEAFNVFTHADNVVQAAFDVVVYADYDVLVVDDFAATGIAVWPAVVADLNL